MSNQIEGLRLHGPVQLASAAAVCWKCQKETPVHALLAADLEEFEAGEDPMRLVSPTFVYEIDPDALPSGIEAALTTLAPNFKPTFSRAVRVTSWANICVYCGMLQGAFFLHSEPDGPFFGGPEEFTEKRVELSSIGFHVGGASYSV